MKKNTDPKGKLTEKIVVLVEQLQAKKIKHKCPDVSKLTTKQLSGLISELSRKLQ